MQTEQPCARRLEAGCSGQPNHRKDAGPLSDGLVPPPQASAVPEQSLTSDPEIQDTLGLSWLQNWVVRRWGAASQDSC